jgi:hypothetical protein
MNKLIVLIGSILLLSGCGVSIYISDKAIDQAIERGNLHQISEYLYSAKSKVHFEGASDRSARKRYERFCQRSGKNSYIQSSNRRGDWLHYEFACVEQNDNSSDAKVLRQTANKLALDDFTRVYGIAKVGKHIYIKPIEKSITKTESIASSYCSQINLTMLPQSQYGSDFTFACISYDDSSLEVSELKKQAKEFQQFKLEKAKQHAKQQAIIDERRAVKRQARKMEELEREKLQLQQQQLYQQQQQQQQLNFLQMQQLNQPKINTYVPPVYAPTLKTECKTFSGSRMGGKVECTTYDTSNPFNL